jgi:pectate lyase
MNHKLHLLFAAAALLGATSATQARDWPVGYSKCADEGEACKAGDAPRQVSYGIKDQWVVKVLSGNPACTTATFGSDPYPGRVKKCAVGPVTAPAPSPAPSPAPTPAPAPAPAPAPSPAPAPVTDATQQSAPADGWAGYGVGTSGGQGAAASAIYSVDSVSQLQAALKAPGSLAKIVRINGTLDMTAADNGGPFKSKSDQAARNAIVLPSNTTLIGVGSTAKLLNARVVIRNVENVVVRNLRIVNPCDIAPVWDSGDGWNAEYDGISIDAAEYVWIDHNSFTDAPVTDDTLPVVNGEVKQCHDGAIDVKNGADFITVSYNLFELHDKNNLVGSSDSSASTDDGHLRVTFHHNLFRNVVQRTPRVRFGRVHVYSNYYEGSKSREVYAHSYSLGVGYKAKIISSDNAFDIAGASACSQVVKNPGSSSKTGAIVDSGSLLNGNPLSLASQCSFSSAVGWTVPYAFTPTPAAQVKAKVEAEAGAGKLGVN